MLSKNKTIVYIYIAGPQICCQNLYMNSQSVMCTHKIKGFEERHAQEMDL